MFCRRCLKLTLIVGTVFLRLMSLLAGSLSSSAAHMSGGQGRNLSGCSIISFGERNALSWKWKLWCAAFLFSPGATLAALPAKLERRCSLTLERERVR